MDDIGARLREELRTFALSPEPGAGPMDVATQAARVEAILEWLLPSIDTLTRTAHQLNQPFLVSAELLGGLDADELDYHLIASLFVLMGRLVDGGLIQLPPAPS